MLSELKIQNLILVEKARIAFGPKLNILTGETGSGKSVILAALKLVAAERAEQDLIGQWGDVASIEAKLGHHTICREIHRSGKSRCLIDGQTVTLSFLKQFIGSGLEIVDQNSSQSLSSEEIQRKKLDLFANLAEETSRFADSYWQEKSLREKLHLAQMKKQEHDQKIQWAGADLELISQVGWKEGEEEALTQEHERLSHAQELILIAQEIIAALTETTTIKQASYRLQSALRFDTKLEPIVSQLKTKALELEEIAEQLRLYIDRLECDPHRLSHIEERLAAIEQLKKRFGPNRMEVEKKRVSCEMLLQEQSELDDTIAQLTQSLAQIEEQNRLLAHSLSAKRKSAATRFQNAVLKELKGLSLPHASFTVRIETQQMHSSGIDAVTFLFSANPGHAAAPLEQCASGGELSRLLFAIHATLSDKENTQCLVFDEIDSNVGGHAATLLGEKLQMLAESRQVICVTHFAQVARYAIDHFAVTKKSGAIEVKPLRGEERETEYLRMGGLK